MSNHYFDTVPSSSRLIHEYDEEYIAPEDILLTSQQRYEKYLKQLYPDNSSDDSIIHASESTESTPSNSPSLSGSESDNLNKTPKQHKEHYYTQSPGLFDRLRQMTNLNLSSSHRKQHNLETEHENEMVLFVNENDNEEQFKKEDENNNENHELNCSRVSKRSTNLNLSLHTVDKHLAEPNSSTCLTSNVDNEREEAAPTQVHHRHPSASHEDSAKLKRNTSDVIYMEKKTSDLVDSKNGDKIKYHSLKPAHMQKFNAGKCYFIVFILFIVNCLNYIDRFTIAGNF